MTNDLIGHVAAWLFGRYGWQPGTPTPPEYREDATTLLAELADEFPAIAAAVDRQRAVGDGTTLREGITEEEIRAEDAKHAPHCCVGYFNGAGIECDDSCRCHDCRTQREDIGA